MTLQYLTHVGLCNSYVIHTKQNLLNTKAVAKKYRVRYCWGGVWCDGWATSDRGPGTAVFMRGPLGSNSSRLLFAVAAWVTSPLPPATTTPQTRPGAPKLFSARNPLLNFSQSKQRQGFLFYFIFFTFDNRFFFVKGEVYAWPNTKHSVALTHLSLLKAFYSHWTVACLMSIAQW